NQQVALGEALLADAQGGAADHLDVEIDVGEVAKEVPGSLEGGAVGAGVDDLVEQARAEALQVNAQALALRGKKPCGKSGKWRRARTRGRHRRGAWRGGVSEPPAGWGLRP